MLLVIQLLLPPTNIFHIIFISQCKKYIKILTPITDKIESIIPLVLEMLNHSSILDYIKDFISTRNKVNYVSEIVLLTN